MATRSRERREPGWKTVLEREPNYLKAIGTVAVETVNAEVMLADLLGVILRVQPDTGDAVYWAPQTMGARLSILHAAVDEEMMFYPRNQRKAFALITRARKLGNRRNDVLHHVWGLDRDVNKIILGQPPASRHPEKHVPLKEVEKLVYDIRLLATDIIDFVDALRENPAYSLHDTPSQPEPENEAAKE